MAKRKFDSDINIPIVDDFASSEFLSVKAEQDVEASGVPSADADKDNYAECNSEEVLYELVRTSSAVYAAACRKMLWFSLQNIHLVVYILFAVVLSIFTVYYGIFDKTPVLAVCAAVACIFMLYVIVRGHSLFVSGMTFDEERAEDTLRCKFCSSGIYINCSGDEHKISYDSITSMRISKNYILIQIKGIKSFGEVLLLEKPGDSDATEELVQLIKIKTNIK